MIAKTTGPTGPRGASGPQGEPGNLALANTACDPAQFVSGFDGDGDPLCGVVDDSGGWRIGLISLAPFTTSRASVDFGEVPVGSRATETITITNQNPQLFGSSGSRRPFRSGPTASPAPMAYHRAGGASSTSCSSRTRRARSSRH